MDQTIAKYVLLFLAFGALFLEANGEEPYKLSPPKSNILLNIDRIGRQFHGGNQTGWESFPYTVSLCKDGLTFAGGAIIAEQYVLTSQDRVRTTYPRDIRVVVGDTERNVTSVIVFNESYIAGYPAVLRLNQKLDFSDPKIQPIQLRADSVTLGTNCTLSGIGTLKTPPATGDVINYVNVPTVDLSACQNYWGSQGFPLGEGHICSGAYGDDQDCWPNPGDPLVCDGVLTGIASLLNLCDNNEYPGTYANVSYHREWIENIINLK